MSTATAINTGHLRHNLNTAQHTAVTAPLAAAVQVLAGAGTGKTTLMAYRYAHALYALSQQRSDVPAHERILAVTFTVKAAEEMRQRVSRVVQAHAAADPDDATWQHLAHTITQQADALWIGNFHGIGQRILRHYGLPMGWGPRFGVLDRVSQARLWHDLLDDATHGRLADAEIALAHADLANDVTATPLHPNALGQLPVHPLGSFLADIPRLIGRIKTAGLTPKAFYQLARRQTQAFSDNITQLPQTGRGNQAFENAEDLIAAWQPHWHEWATPGWQLGGTPTEQQAFIAKRTVELKRGDPTDLTPFYKERLKWLTDKVNVVANGDALPPFPHAKGKGIAPGVPVSLLQQIMAEVTADELALLPVVAGLYALYQYRLFAQNQCDMDDLILHPIALLQQQPDIQAHLQQQFACRIVDECQDTNGSQLALIHALTPPENPGLMVVGDEKQAIYGFRFAQPENIHLMVSGYQPLRVTLSENYRSSPAILAVANGAARQLGLVGDPTLTASGQQATNTTPVRHVLIGNNNSDKLSQATVYDAEMTWIARHLQAAHQAGRTWTDMAVLTSSHGRAARLATVLSAAGIPNQRDKKPLLAEATVNRWLYLLQWLANPHADEAMIAMLQTRLNDAQLRWLADGRYQLKVRQNLAYNPPYERVVEALQDTTFLPQLDLTVRTALLHLRQRMVETRQQLKYGQWVPLVEALATDLGLWCDLPNIAAYETPTDVTATGHWILECQQQPAFKYHTLRQWVAYLLACQEAGDGPTAPVTPNGVHLLTMHAAKGLEFPLVVVSATDKRQRQDRDGSLLDVEPRFSTANTDNTTGFGLYLCKHGHFLKDGTSATTLKRQIVNNIWTYPREDAEQQRLFYVALTRAMEDLTIVRGPASPTWTDPTQLVHHTETHHVLTEIVVGCEKS